MKPLYLKIEGLNSFLERQEIDFRTVSDLGVFGIFGPTGSGKSTILDAITLALYGKVERAARGTQGIINHSADRVMVEFTFEIGVGASRKQYRVTRIYRRAGENNVHNTHARLIEISPQGEVVLADREKDVSKSIAGIIGLNEEDFTRAVVLPQGKFADFLTLEGAKRNKMLQRLFGLEGYGARLNEKIKVRLTQAQTALAGVQGELQGLGDASPQALEKARETLAQVLKKKEACFTQREKMRREFEQWKEVWFLQEELMAKTTMVAQLELQGPAMALKAARLEAARRAEIVRPYLEAVKNTEEAFRQSVARVEEGRANLEAALIGVLASRQRFEEAREKRRQEEPLLLAQKGQLSRAVELEEEINGMKQTACRQQEQMEEKKQQLVSAEESLDRIQTRKQELEKLVAGSKEAAAQVAVDPEYRRRVALALACYREWQVAQRDYQDRLEDFRAKKASQDYLEEVLAEEKRAAAQALEKVRFVEEQLAAHKGSEPFTEEKILQLQQSLERGRAQVAEIKRCHQELARLVEEKRKVQQLLEQHLALVREAETRLGKITGEHGRVETDLREAEENLRVAERQHLASVMAEELREGHPCPVCGSSHHPAPAARKPGQVIAEARRLLEEKQNLFRKLAGELTAASADHAQKVAQWEALGRTLESLQGEILAREEELGQVRKGMAREELRDLSLAELEEFLAGFEERVAGARLARQRWQSRAEALQRELEEARREGALAEQKLARAETAEKKSQEDLALAQAKAEEARIAFEGKREALARAQEDIGGKDVLAAEEEVARRDRESVRIAGELAEMEKTLEQLTRELNIQIEEKNALMRETASLEAGYEALAGQIRERERQIQDITGGKPGGVLLEENQRLLALLAEEEEKARQALEEARQRQAQAEQAKAAAEGQLEIILQRKEETRRSLEQILAQENFADAAEAEKAWCSPEERALLEQELAIFREQEQSLKGQIQSLEEKLGGRSLSREQWEIWQGQKETIEAEYEAAAQAAGIACKEWEEMQQNHSRWLALERERGSLTELINRLELLRKIFKGDAFVEFIAQEQMENVVLTASRRLKEMTGHRYALELDGEGTFIMRDDANGGVKRPVSTLSGGETFLTSLALALALSAQIQLKGQYPLEFFFLDEGFGTLDSELLDKVMNILEQLPGDRMTIGVISHVPEMRQRMARRLMVEPARPGEGGSRVKFEVM